MKVANVISTGLGVSYQDAGRPGWRRFGVPPGGVMDARSSSLANKLLENHSHATVLEFTLHGAEIELTVDTWVSLTGACSSSNLPAGSARAIKAGERLKLAPSPNGIWSYLAIPGGWKSEHCFGSASYDPRSHLGEAINSNSTLEAHRSQLFPFPDSIANRLSTPDLSLNFTPPVDRFELLPGPQYHKFPQNSRHALVENVWKISSQSDRTGYRLEGPPLDLAPDITSEPVLPGSIQVPGNGIPIITMPDGPTVGGYPKIAYMEPTTRWRLAQCQPGSQIRFRWIT